MFWASSQELVGILHRYLLELPQEYNLKSPNNLLDYRPKILQNTYTSQELVEIPPLQFCHEIILNSDQQFIEIPPWNSSEFRPEIHLHFTKEIDENFIGIPFKSSTQEFVRIYPKNSSELHQSSA